jgi:RNA 3'-terminal phosphate cyclase (ATP)
MRQGVEIDGARGEGGGQILRTSLALSIITQRPLHMWRIRAGRARPGLQRQHLACVHAAVQLCGGTVRGAEVGSQKLDFTPAEAWADDIELDIGTAGSTTLVIQTILVPAIASGRSLRAVITGGTHNPLAPPFDYLERVFVPHLRAMGANVQLTLERHGLMPKGGGRVVLEVRPSAKLRPIEIVDAGGVTRRRAIAIIGGLPTHVADRELGVARASGVPADGCEVVEVPRAGPANVFMLEVELAGGARELVTVHGEKGLRAETVAQRAIDEVAAFCNSGVPVGAHLADQLLLPMAVAGSGRFRTFAPLSLHATTNIDTINAFLDVPIQTEPTGAAVDVIVG